MPFVSENNTRFLAVRSSGPGGQRVNRRSTKVHVWARVADLQVSDDEKRLIREKLAGRINQNDELEVSCEEERAQAMNHARAIERMNELIAEAVTVSPERIPTEPSHGAKIAAMVRKEKRYKKKKLRSESRHPEEG
ncbi:MAG: peptide chain release factor-like protein [Candidatus Jorgensenbacteria bacterium]|nr:peptide chain release factor-like protein [Candidatus Jorgensenbacteria bacterium]